MSVTTTQRVELPEGYSVIDRLGAGGYGEVWKATAPGGLEKAVKVIFGHCDECMAERELKSLERIKSVRHPFLLSIERFEIVNNRLVIVTELADMSLSDCFQNHVAEGNTGIPRDQLIAYLWDAAEALDCLIEHHSLQHLDVKPENLLVVGDHIKVADFGLVKELASKTLNSVMGGMTPLYSAPEIYDNNPSPRSDQYSLAIVYQHMLTATLPFSGRTPAQLAKQHTLAKPNVNPLNEADRAIVNKALEKNPQDRFASCREFVSALRLGGQVGSVSHGAPSAASASARPQSKSSDDTKSISLIDTKQLRDPLCIAATHVLASNGSGMDDAMAGAPRAASRPQLMADFPVVDGQIVDVESPAFDSSATATPVPTLFVGVGGIGIKLLKAVRNQVNAHDPNDHLALAWLAIDTELESLKSLYSEENHASLSADEMLHIPLRRPSQYRDDSQALLRWVSRRWLYNIPRSLQTRGYRPLGRIAMVDHAAAVLGVLEKRLHGLATNSQGTEGTASPLRVVVLAGMSGGTGGGTIIDVAQAVRSICDKHSQQVEVQGILGCTYHPDSNDSLAAANMYSLLTELSHAQHDGNCGESPPPGPASRYESQHAPFNEIYTVPISSRSRRADDLALQSVANYVLLEAGGAIRSAVNTIRSASSEEADRGLLRTFNCARIGQLAAQLSAYYQQELLRDVVQYWLQQVPATNDPDSRFFQTQANSQFARAILTHFPEVSPEVSAAPNDPVAAADSETQKSRRSATIKSLAKCFLQFLDTVELQLDGDHLPLDDASIAAASDRIIANLSQRLEQDNPSEQELAPQLLELMSEHLAELAANSTGAEKSKLAETVLALFSSGPLDCGYQRRTILVSPQDETDPTLKQAFAESCSTLAICSSTIDEMYLIREGSGLNPLHLGARLAELYPDIAEAGGRLHSRNDIPWHDLREAMPEVAESVCD